MCYSNMLKQKIDFSITIKNPKISGNDLNEQKMFFVNIKRKNKKIKRK